MMYKLLLKKKENKNDFGYEDPLELKKGEVAFDFRGKTDDYEFNFKKGDEVLYENGRECRIDGKDYLLVSLTSLICQKK